VVSFTLQWPLLQGEKERAPLDELDSERSDKETMLLLELQRPTCCRLVWLSEYIKIFFLS